MECLNKDRKALVLAPDKARQREQISHRKKEISDKADVERGY